MLTVYPTVADVPDNFLGALQPVLAHNLRNTAATFGLEAFPSGLVAYYPHPTLGWVTELLTESGNRYTESHGINAAKAFDKFVILCRIMVLSCLSGVPMANYINQDEMIMQ